MTVHPARKPRRIQRKRTKGWSMPRDAVYVGRGSKFGNGWKIGDPHPDDGHPITRDEAVALYGQSLAQASPDTLRIIRRDLAGRDLACWCRPDQKCHADLLLALANTPAAQRAPSSSPAAGDQGTPCACGSLTLDTTPSERHDRGLHGPDSCNTTLATAAFPAPLKEAPRGYTTPEAIAEDAGFHTPAKENA